MFAHFGGNGFGGVTITAAIYDDVKSGLRQLVGDATADILSRSSDQGGFSVTMHCLPL
jgi:hypothetical protein